MKRIILISALYLIFQTAFAQKQEKKPLLSSEISFQINSASLNSSNDIEACKQFCKSVHVDIARNSGGKQSEGRLPTAYSESLCKIRITRSTKVSVRNNDGKHGEGLFPGEYSKNLNKNRTNVIADDIARNCGGRNSN